MKIKKVTRFFVAFLSILLLLTMIPTGVFAEETAVPKTTISSEPESEEPDNGADAEDPEFQEDLTDPAREEMPEAAIALEETPEAAAAEETPEPARKPEQEAAEESEAVPEENALASEENTADPEEEAATAPEENTADPKEEAVTAPEEALSKETSPAVPEEPVRVQTEETDPKNAAALSSEDTEGDTAEAVGTETEKEEQTITADKNSYTKKVTDSDFTIGVQQLGDGEITFASSDTSVAAVGEATGTVTVKKPGTAKITVTAAETDHYKKAVITVTVKVEKADQKIRLAKKIYTKKLNASGFTINASLTQGDGALTYKSSNTAVAAVGKKTGKITMRKPGTVTITVTAASTANYNKATAAVTLKVQKPAPTKWVSVTAHGKKKIELNWKKVTGVTGYQIQYSTSSSFKSGNKTVKIAGASKTSKTLTMPASDKKYYFRIRTYKKVGKVTTRSAWSAKKAVTSKTVLENWIQLQRTGYGEWQQLGDYWYYYEKENSVEDSVQIYAIYRVDKDFNTEKLMTVENGYDTSEIYTNGDYIVYTDPQYLGPVVWRSNMDGSGRKMILDLRLPEGGNGLNSVYLYGRNLYYSYSYGFDYYQDTYKVDILTKSKTLHKHGLIPVQHQFDGRYAVMENAEGAAWVYDAKTDVYRKLSSARANVEKVSGKWYYATFSATGSNSGKFTIWKKALSGKGKAAKVAAFTPDFPVTDVLDVIQIDETGAYFLRTNEKVYKYDFAKKKMKKTKLTVWDIIARNMRYL